MIRAVGKNSIASARTAIPEVCASGVDPAVVFLHEHVRANAGYVGQIAQAAGIDRRCISRWIRGKASPNVANLRAVFNVLGFEITVTRRGEP